MSGRVLVPVWLVPVVIVLSLFFGMVLSNPEGIRLGYSYGMKAKLDGRDKADRNSAEGELNYECADGGVFIIRVDERVSEPIKYSVKYGVDSKPLEQWKNHVSIFSFRNDKVAKRVHDSFQAIMREEMSRAIKEGY